MSRRGGGRGKVSHKGRRRHFTDAEDLKHDLEKAKREQEWREARGELPSDEEVVKVGSDDSSSSSEEEDDKSKAKGVSSLIDVENPNRAQQKMKKVTTIDVNSGGATAQLSRREREEIAKQQDKIRYDKLHAEGKTDQAKADLARLAIIKKQREEVAKKRNEEKKAKEMVAAAKASKK